MKHLFLGRAAVAYIKRATGLHPLILVRPEIENEQRSIYHLFNEDSQAYLGCILFDENDYWIYDGQELTVPESEAIHDFIIQAARRQYVNEEQGSLSIWDASKRWNS